MGIFDKFRPTWKNSDASVRREAVTALGADELGVLAEVLRTDPDASVRMAAIKRVEDVELLAARAAEDVDEEVRDLAAARADQLRLRAVLDATVEREALVTVTALMLPRSLAEVARKAESKAVRGAALARVSAQPLLLELAQTATDPAIRRGAFDRISEPQLLKHFALHEGTRELQLQAVARLEDLEALGTVAARAPVKAVRSAAAEKVRAKKRQSAPEKPPGAGAAQPQDLSRMVAALEGRRQQVAEETRMRSAPELMALMKLAPAPAKAVAAGAKAPSAMAKAPAGPVTAAAAPIEAAPAPAVDERQLEQQRLRAARAAEAEARRAEQEARRAALQVARDAEAQRRREDQAAKDAARAEEEKRYVAAAAAVWERLEALRESDDRKVLDEALQAARAVPALRGRAGEAAEAARKRLEEARATVSARLNDLREAESWRRWANVPKFEQLIAGLEALLATPEHDAKELAQRLKAMQADWKALGAAPREKADLLWGRFKQLADEVHARAQQGFAVLDSERLANLEKKRELIARAETAAESIVGAAGSASRPAGSADWKETAELFKQLQEEWKAIGPVPRAEADAVWQQFRAVCDRFFAARKVVLDVRDGERAANLTRLVALCERAEGLKGSTEWKGTAEALKALQAEWKAIGPAGRAEADEVWQRFRAACDAFFERRKAAFAVEDDKRAANLKKKEEILARAEALADGDEVADPESTIRALMLEWKQVGQVPRDRSDELWSRFRTACDKIRSPAPVDSEAVAAMAAAGTFSNRPLEALGRAGRNSS